MRDLAEAAVVAVTVVVAVAVAEGSVDFVEEPVHQVVLASHSVEGAVVALVPAAAVVAEEFEAVSLEDWYQKYPAVCFHGEREKVRGEKGVKELGGGGERERERRMLNNSK